MAGMATFRTCEGSCQGLPLPQLCHSVWDYTTESIYLVEAVQNALATNVTAYKLGGTKDMVVLIMDRTTTL
jgi:hypothetical protein